MCAGGLRRVPRRLQERASTQQAGLRRYRCAAGCGWEGLLPRRPSARRPLRPAARRAPWIRRALPFALCALAGVGFGAVAVFAVMSGPGPGRSAAPAPWLAPGQHHEGLALDARHPFLRQPETEAPAVERLALRQRCAWGTPGRSPYQGSVEQALVSARLPPEVVERVALKVRQGQVDDRLEIRNEGIRPSRGGREFDPDNVALTWGHTLCLNARVNFPAGHVERASLYEAADRQGRLHSVMVPDVCGNVSVLGVRGERKPVPAAVLAVGDEEGPQLLRLLAPGIEAGPARAVPAPPTLVLVGLALALAAARGGWAVFVQALSRASSGRCGPPAAPSRRSSRARSPGAC